MRSPTRLALLALTTLAALALTAPAASAQHEEVEVLNEHVQGMSHCNPCQVLVESTTQTTFTAHVSGFEFVQIVCNDTFEVEIYENGEGHIPEGSITLSGAGCPKEACTAAPEDTWPLHLEEFGPGDVRMGIRLCLQNIGDPTTAQHCDLTVDINDLGNHHYEFNSPDRPCGGPSPAQLEVTGHWIIHENAPEHNDVELVH